MTSQEAAGWTDMPGDGETVLWQGRPDARIVWNDIVSAQGAAGLLITGISLLGLSGLGKLAFGDGVGVNRLFAFPLFHLPFLLVGLYLMLGPIFRDAFLRGRTWYKLTNRAAYIARDIRGKRSLARYPFEEMSSPDLHDDAPGSVFFAEESRLHRYNADRHSGPSRGTRTRTVRIPIGFRRIDDAPRVYRLIQDHRDEAQAP